MGDKRERKAVCTGIRLAGILIVFVGAMPGSFLGGVFGLRIAGFMSGHPVGSSLLPRIIVLAGMIAGLLLSAAASMGVVFFAGRLLSELCTRLLGSGASCAAWGRAAVKE